jgi:tetratricopeptide (TPR) repeat protein
MTQNNLGNAYQSLPTGDRGENLQQAIECYQAALQVSTETAFPADWAITQNNLGAAYLYLPTGDRGDNLQRAIECYQAALRVRMLESDPNGYAVTNYNLALVYRVLSEIADRRINLILAIAAAEQSVLGYSAVNNQRALAKAKILLGQLKAALEEEPG